MLRSVMLCHSMTGTHPKAAAAERFDLHNPFRHLDEVNTQVYFLSLTLPLSLSFFLLSLSPLLQHLWEEK